MLAGPSLCLAEEPRLQVSGDGQMRLRQVSSTGVEPVGAYGVRVLLYTIGGMALPNAKRAGGMAGNGCDSGVAMVA